jgi:serine/threonine protein kinase
MKLMNNKNKLIPILEEMNMDEYDIILVIDELNNDVTTTNIINSSIKSNIDINKSLYKVDNKDICYIEPLIKKEITVPSMYTGYFVFGNKKHDVVVKAECNERDINNEKKIYQYLSDKSKDNSGCITMYGYDLTVVPRYIVFERMDSDLSYYLSNELPTEMRRELFNKIIFAFQNLHNLGVVHLDVKLENIGIKSDKYRKYVKILDLDSACIISNKSFYPHQNGNLKYTDDWTSPEIYNSKGGELKAAYSMDIFCLGLIGNLLFSDNLNEDKTNFNNPESFQKAMKDDVYLKSLIKCDEAIDFYRELIQSMCSYNENDRPTINEVYRNIVNKTYTKFAKNASVTETIISKMNENSTTTQDNIIARITELNIDLITELDDVLIELNENTIHSTKIIIDSIAKLSEMTQNIYNNFYESLNNLNNSDEVERNNQKDILENAIFMLQEQQDVIKNNNGVIGNIDIKMNELSIILSEMKSNEISSSLQPILSNMNSNNSSENIDDKLNALINMMQNMNYKIDSIDVNINKLKNLTTSLEMKGNMMPITFIIKPKPIKNKLDSSASSLSKIKNFVK